MTMMHNSRLNSAPGKTKKRRSEDTLYNPVSPGFKNGVRSQSAETFAVAQGGSEAGGYSGQLYDYDSCPFLCVHDF